MASLGFAFLVAAFSASVAAVALLFAGLASGRGILSKLGRVAVLVTFASLLVCCGILVWCFMVGDVSILYVLQERSLSSDDLAWLYKLSGLWAGRAGSLLFWTTLIALFDVVILARYVREHAAGYYTHVKRHPSAVFCQADSDAAVRLDDLAMSVVSVVVAVFCGILLFSEGNMPFEPTPPTYFDPDGALTPMASLYSMNQLLEHWAMAIHPPLLFVGYAGLTVPFAYAIAALVSNDSSVRWVDRSQRFVLASWLFLGAGIGLGAVWAYVVLGWGGYWGWDPVENASLLSWLVCVALAHTFTAYRQRGAFKRWAIMCACLAFTFVIVATFITRSGVVQSVHAFAGDPVSLVLFGGLIVVSLVLPLVLIALRWKAFAPDTAGADEVENLASKEAAYYFNNVIMLLFTFLLAYMTLASALPSWLPFGGESLGAIAYEAIARPLGILYLLILAACPLLAWGKTDPKKFARQARVPAVCALVLFALLAFWWATQFLPTYDATMAKGDATALALLEAGPPWYYNGLALAGLLVASLLFFNALFMLARNVRAKGKRGAAIGGAFAHTAMAVILVGLIGSNMYAYEQTAYIGAQEGSKLTVAEYDIVYTGDSIDDRIDADGTVLYQVSFDVYKDGRPVGQVQPSVQLDVMTQQQKLNAAVLSFPEEDLFVVYHGATADGRLLSIDVHVNPFISLVWVGFGMLMIGTLLALVLPRRRPARAGGGGGSDGGLEGAVRAGGEPG